MAGNAKIDTAGWEILWICPVCGDQDFLNNEDDYEVIDKDKPWRIKITCPFCGEELSIDLISALME